MEEGGGGAADEAGSGAELDDADGCGVGVVEWLVRGGGGWFDIGEMAREESGESFGEQVGCHPCFVAEVIVRQGRFV